MAQQQSCPPPRRPTKEDPLPESANRLFVVPLVLFGLLGLVAAAVPAIAMTRRSRSAPAATVSSLTPASRRQPATANEWHDRADALFQRADLAGALDAIQTSIELLEPEALAADAAESPRLSLAHAHLLQGRVLEALPPTRCAGGTCTEHAANAYRRALIRAPEGAAQLPEAERALRRVSGSLDGASAPYVAALFDEYAGNFDAALSRLDYKAPALVAQAVRDVVLGEREQRQQQPPLLGSVLDAGCGTGLVGVELRPMARRLVGVDLSGGMLAQACLAHATPRTLGIEPPSPHLQPPTLPSPYIAGARAERGVRRAAPGGAGGVPAALHSARCRHAWLPGQHAAHVSATTRGFTPASLPASSERA